MGNQPGRAATDVKAKPQAKTGLNCDNHTMIDLPGLAELQDKNYLASKRRGCKGYDIIVKNMLWLWRCILGMALLFG